MGAAGGLSGIYSGLGSGLDTSFRGQGQGAYTAAVGVGDARAEGEMADYTASKNVWDSIFKAAQIASQVYGHARRPQK